MSPPAAAPAQTGSEDGTSFGAWGFARMPAIELRRMNAATRAGSGPAQDRLRRAGPRALGLSRMQAVPDEAHRREQQDPTDEAFAARSREVMAPPTSESGIEVRANGPSDRHEEQPARWKRIVARVATRTLSTRAVDRFVGEERRYGREVVRRAGVADRRVQDRHDEEHGAEQRYIWRHACG